jgi:hypothetical protein
MNWKCLRAGFWGEYLHLEGLSKRRLEKYVIRGFIICVHL